MASSVFGAVYQFSEDRVVSPPKASSVRPLINEPAGRLDNGVSGLAPLGQGKSILVVEDNPDIRQLISVTLSSLGMPLTLLADGQVMARRIEESPPPNVVILDRMLPGLSGDILLKRIRFSETWGEVPVIMISALRRKFDVDQLLRAGANLYLPKPLDLRALVGAVDKYVNHSQAEAAL